MGSNSNAAGNAWATEPIAIVGMSTKFAGEATNTENFWRMIEEARSGWTPFPASRFRPEGVYHPNNERLNSTHVKGAHLLSEDVALFDAAFFSYSSETASSLDPQYRLQLESVYEALENAGLPLAQLTGSNTSVFTGVFVHDYRDGLLRDADNLPRLMATGTGVPMMSNRISHFFDFRGASMTIETACSSGMVAMHQAVQSLRTGEADMSIVGGANLTLNPDMFKALGSAGFLSADGKCYAFDHRASGYGRGEGVATLVIKRLSDALAAGDPIRAIVRESMINQDGKTETITTPSLEAQKALVRGCYAKAGLDPQDTQYFEAHGTGTQAGDTVEARAIADVFASRSDPLLIGSVKTNIGHTEAASGLGSIIKVALAIDRGVIPPTINFEKPNPKLHLDDWNLKLVRQLEAWPEAPVRRASINNFGYGGTNAHIILESTAPWVPTPAAITSGSEPASPPSKVLILSGKDEQACQAMISNIATFLSSEAQTSVAANPLLESLIYTLGERRTRFPWTAAYPIPTDTSDLSTVVSTLQSPKFKPSRSARKPRIGLVFTGQGAQWHAMGRELVDAYPAYRAALEEAEGHLKEFGASWSLLEELGRDAETSRVNDVALSTPITVAVQIALVALLRAWGIEAVGVASHSSGEIAAAYAVGAMSCRTAMAFAYYRAVLAADPKMRGPVKGGMIAVGLGLEETEGYLKKLTAEGKAVVACINSPSSITVAGDLPPVKELEELCTADGVFARRLKVDVAWHSHHMAKLADVYVKTLEKVDTSDDAAAASKIAFSSPVTGARMDDHKEIARPEHWVQSLVQPVQFVSAFTDMVLGETGTAASNIDVVVEVGPHTALGGPIQQILALPAFKDVQIPYYGCLVRKTDARESMQLLASRLLQEGYPVDMAAVNFPHGRGSQVKVLTDLPSYPWNHQVRHWVEPRANRALRERSQQPHDLLGSIVEGSNPEAPSWRHHLRISDSPWTRDHAIQGNVVYPAAGYLSLAIEAIKQLTALHPPATATKTTGFRLRDVDFLQALMIPDTSDGIEIQTSLRPVPTKNVGTQAWKQFEVWSVTSDNRWTQHAQGLISFESSPSPSTLITPRQPLKGYTRRVIPSDLFSNLRALGISHGPVFQNFKGIVQAGQESARRSEVTISVPDTSVPKDLPRSPIVHPVTLDAIITAPYSAVPGAAARETAAKVPRAVEEFWVSADISHAAGHLFVADSAIVRDDSAGMAADVAVRDQEAGKVVLEMRGFAYQSLGAVLSLQQAEEWETELVNRVDWGLDLSLASSATVAKVEKELGAKAGAEEKALDKGLWRVCVHFMQQALAALEPRDVENMEPHEAKYHAWMKETVRRAASGELTEGSGSWRVGQQAHVQKLIEQVSGARVDGEMIARIGSQLVAILRGQAAPLEVMVQEGLLFKYNSETPRATRKGTQIAGLIRHLVHKNPRARILEIGSGTGAVSRHALEAVGSAQSGGPNASLYHFTDVAATFFEGQKEQFSAWSDLLSFDVLDIERDPATQGFTAGSYDIVIAAAVLSKTKSVSRALGNVRSLIKPGGSLLLAEDVQPQLDTQFLGALLPQWWSGEEPERATNPLLSTSAWKQQLQTAGFSGAALELHDGESAETSSSVTILSTVPKSESSKLRANLEKIAIVTSSKAAPPSDWLKSLESSITAITHGGKDAPAVYDLESTPAASFVEKICVFVGEVDEPILHELNESSLEGIRAMSTNCKGLLWVTRGGAVDCERPELSLAAGFVRTLRNEYVGRNLLTLDLDPSGEIWSEAGSSAIVQVLQASFGEESGEKAAAEYEFAEREGVILVPRLNHDVTRDQKLSPKAAAAAGSEAISSQPLYQADRPLCLQPESFAFGDDVLAQAFRDSLSPALIEVEPRAYGVELSGADERIVGRECAGVITRVGREAAAKGYSVGDRVLCVLQQASFPSRAIVAWNLTTRIPDDLSFELAASLPVAFLTAYFSLVETARLRRSQSVLIHAAAGSIGQAAIMVAQHLGAEVFATVASPEERESVIENYNLPKDRVFDRESFGSAVLKATKGRGVDVVLNSLAGPLLQESFNLVAPLGYFIETGKRDVEGNSNLEMKPFARGVTFSAVDLPVLLEHRAADVHRCFGEVMRLVKAKVAKPVQPVNTYALGEIIDASRLLQTGHYNGKLILTVGPDARVPVLPRTEVATLSPDASYLIVGGNGGLGQSVAHWLVSRGARNLVLLSRSAGKSEKMAALAAELREAGCTRVLPVSCDVADEDSLASALDTCADEGLPPVRGVIHAAFVLYDNFVEKMTLDDWTRTTSSKVAGAWNLHSQFPLASDLDFFVLFSSINGVLGYASQSAYAAAGAYEDAFAHWRVKSAGLPAVALDLSVVNSVGYVAEAAGAETLRKALVKAGRRAIDESHVLAALESAILRPFDPQFVVGGVNSGPGPHWDVDGDLGRDARAAPLKYRPRKEADGDAQAGAGADTLAAKMAACGSREEAVKVVGAAMAEILADMFLVPVEDIDLSESPSQQGIDSLMAVEVRNLLFKQAAAELSIFNIMQSPSLNVLAADVVDRSSHVEFAAAA